VSCWRLAGCSGVNALAFRAVAEAFQARFARGFQPRSSAVRRSSRDATRPEPVAVLQGRGGRARLPARPVQALLQRLRLPGASEGGSAAGRWGSALNRSPAPGGLPRLSMASMRNDSAGVLPSSRSRTREQVLGITFQSPFQTVPKVPQGSQRIARRCTSKPQIPVLGPPADLQALIVEVKASGLPSGSAPPPGETRRSGSVAREVAVYHPQGSQHSRS